MKPLKILVFIACAVATGAWFARDGWAEAHRQQAEAKVQQNRMSAAERKRADLLRQEATVSGPTGREASARKDGWTMPNEVPAPK